jgi:phosphoribosylglycinamide formyltransferase-1
MFRDPGRVGILISGRGSNMVSLVQAMQRGEIPAEPVVVISNKPDAAGLAKAREMGVPVEVVDQKQVKPRSAHEKAVVDVLNRYQVDLVCLAGYMRLLKSTFISAFQNRILNIHPSLLPAFPGLDAQEQALNYGVKVAGCTVHFVDEKCDHGPIILQAQVPVLDDDTAETLSARILEQEHRVYPQALAIYFQDGLTVKGRQVLKGVTTAR